MNTLERARLQKDIARLKAKFTVESKGNDEFSYIVEFNGPTDSPYELGTWKVALVLSEKYPFQSPTIRFMTRIFHPNISYKSGLLCKDFLRNSWTPIYDLLNVFQIFLPQILAFPVPQPFLNFNATRLLVKDIKIYHKKVRKQTIKYALNFKSFVKSFIKKIDQSMGTFEDESMAKKQVKKSEKEGLKEISELREQEEDSMMEGSSLSQILDDDLKLY